MLSDQGRQGGNGASANRHRNQQPDRIDSLGWIIQPSGLGYLAHVTPDNLPGADENCDRSPTSRPPSAGMISRLTDLPELSTRGW
jgi:hypothetical protein